MPTTNTITEKVALDDEIVISGIAGRYPNSDNVEILKQSLLNKVDLITNDERRWKLGDYNYFITFEF